MCTKTKYINKLKGPWPSRGIDTWIRNQMKINPRYRHTTPLLGLHTDGENKISIKRRSHYKTNKWGLHFTKPNQTLLQYYQKK